MKIKPNTKFIRVITALIKAKKSGKGNEAAIPVLFEGEDYVVLLTVATKGEVIKARKQRENDDSAQD